MEKPKSHSATYHRIYFTYHRIYFAYHRIYFAYHRIYFAYHRIYFTYHRIYFAYHRIYFIEPLTHTPGERLGSLTEGSDLPRWRRNDKATY